MADFEQKFDLDLRFGGSTLGDFGYFYDVELPYIYKCLNSLRRNQQSPTGETVAPAPNMWKVEDGHIYIRNEENTDWVLMLDQAYRGGLYAQGESLLKNTDLATENSKANKVAVYDSSGNIPSNISGSPGMIAGKAVDMTGLEDGQVMAYSAGTNKWIPADRFSGVGQGRTLSFYDSSGVFATYNGGSPTDVDMPVHGLHPSRNYAYGDVANTSLLPSSSMLVCVVAGTTGDTLPQNLM